MVLKHCQDVNYQGNLYNDAISTVLIPTRETMKLDDRDATADVSL